MKVTRLAGYAAMILLATTLGACSSSVKRNGDTMNQAAAQPAAPQPVKVAKVDITFSDAAKEKYRDNLKFDPTRFQGTLDRTLQGLALMDKDTQNTLKVTVNDVRVRSTFSAVMWGFMAGSDFLEGTVDINDHNGNTVRSFDITASYALGGFGGGQDDTRLSWLYEEFAKLTAQELSGTSN